MACCLDGTKPSSEPMLEYCYLDPWELQWNLNRNLYIFIKENAFENIVWKMVIILSQPKHVNWMAIEVRTWMSNYISLFYMDVITYPYPNPDVSSATPL